MPAENLFFDDWDGLLRVAATGVLAYVVLVALIRFSGKRTLSKMNAFDFVVTVALGSVLAATLLDSTVPLAEGATALATLVGLQYGVAWLQLRSAAVRRIAKSEPRLLFYQGAYLEDAMRAERVVRAEIRQAMRAAGCGAESAVEAVVLETDGTLAVVTGPQDRTSALADLEGTA